MAKKGSKKDFRERWNKVMPAQNIGEFTEDGIRKWDRRGVYGQRKRAYGDYLWFQDREMFNLSFEDWSKDPEKYAERHGKIFSMKEIAHKE